MLVVADEPALRVGAQGRLAGPAEAEEHRRVAVLADVGRAVHAQHVPVLGQDEVQHAEDALLDLAGIGGATDQDHLAGEVHRREVVLARTVNLRVGQKARSADDVPFGHEVRQLLARGAHEHIVPEKGVPRQLRHQA